MGLLDRRISALEANLPRQAAANGAATIDPDEAYRRMCEGDGNAPVARGGTSAMDAYLAMLDRTPRAQRKTTHATA